MRAFRWAIALAVITPLIGACRFKLEMHSRESGARFQIAASTRRSPGDAIPASTPTRPRKVRLAIILCKFLDKPVEIRPPSFYKHYYTELGTGSLADYWYAVSLGGLDLSSSEVLGWFTMNHSSGEVPRLLFPGGRAALVQWGKDAAAANGADLSRYDGFIVVHNWGIDHGAAAGGIVIVDQHPEFVESTFIAHEMGHLFGLPHSFAEISSCRRPCGEYCDSWDIMSAMNVFMGPDDFEGINGPSGPGLNVFGVRRVAGFPEGTLLSIGKPDFDETVELRPLSEPIESNGWRAIEILPNATTPSRPGGSVFTVEYRHKGGWDEGLPHDAVLIHEEKGGRSYLQEAANGPALVAGQRYVTSAPSVAVEVVSIDPLSGTAVVHLRDESH